MFEFSIVINLKFDLLKIVIVLLNSYFHYCDLGKISNKSGIKCLLFNIDIFFICLKFIILKTNWK